MSPIPTSRLGMSGKDSWLVGWGSYLVNAATDCSGCHTFPEFLPKGDKSGSNPEAGDPYTPPPYQRVRGPLLANINTSHYLAGGQCFGPFMARNLTPDSTGRTEGLTEAEFIKVMRTGEDIHCEKYPTDQICALGPPTAVLQVMPWPTYHNLSDFDLSAIYAYLNVLPAASPCNTVADGCPGPSGAYSYPNTADCPNPAPPQ